MQTGENEQALRAAIDFIRKSSVVLLGLHCYFFCYTSFDQWGLTFDILKRVLLSFAKIGIFSSLVYSKLLIFSLLGISLIGAKGKKDEKTTLAAVMVLIVTGLLLFFGSFLVFYLQAPLEIIALTYMGITIIGFLCMMAGGTRLSRLIKVQLRKDIFNIENETFPQDTQLRENEYSVNFPATFRYKGKVRNSFVSIINPFRACLISGTPGS